MEGHIILRSFIKEHIGAGLTTIIDYGLDLAPYIGSFNQTRKILRAEKRIMNHSLQLQHIQKLFANEMLSNEFIQEKIGPIIMSDLIEEHEDSKVIYILNGFENVFINQNSNESLIINYYDTLRDLRYEDIKKLYYYAAIAEDPFKEIEAGSPLEGLSHQIFSKLERLYLIKSAKIWASLEVGAELLSEEDRKVELTTYGLEFIKFISKDFDEKRYRDKISTYQIPEDDKVSKYVKARFG